METMANQDLYRFFRQSSGQAFERYLKSSSGRAFLKKRPSNLAITRQRSLSQQIQRSRENKFFPFGVGFGGRVEPVFRDQ